MHYDYAVHGSHPRTHTLSIYSSYSGTAALRHFVIRTEYRHPFCDTVLCTPLRRACGASCIRLRYILIVWVTNQTKLFLTPPQKKNFPGRGVGYKLFIGRIIMKKQ